MNPYVIGISGNMGAGKTTLANALAQKLTATLVTWDDFDEISKAPQDYVDWYHRGQNYHEWDYPALANVLDALKSQQHVAHPVTQEVLKPTEYIIFDAPLGRLHPQTSTYIDVWIHIAAPLDVSLCRHLIRNFRNNDKSKDELLAELEYYLKYSRPLFFDDEYKAKADLVSDGLLPIDEQVAKVLAYLRTR